MQRLSSEGEHVSRVCADSRRSWLGEAAREVAAETHARKSTWEWYLCAKWVEMGTLGASVSKQPESCC